MIDPAKVKTNIVIFDCEQTGKTAVEWCDILYKRGLWAQDTAQYSVRFVTHCDVNEAQIERALVICKRRLGSRRELARDRWQIFATESTDGIGLGRECVRRCLCVGAVAHAAAATVRSAGTEESCRKALRGSSTSAPTADEAGAFLADAEARLLDLGVKASHANWVQENFITEDTE